MTLDSMIDAARASEARLDDQRRAEILDRVLDDDGAAVATPLVGAPGLGRRWPRRVAVGAAGLALAAAITLVILKLGADGDPAPPPASEVRLPRAPAGVPPRRSPVGVKPPDRAPSIFSWGSLLPPRRVLVAPSALETYRLSGDRQIVPDDATKTEIQKAGRTEVVAAVRFCVDRTGHVSSTLLGRSSGFPAYDAKIVAGVRTWTYRPYLVNGVAVEVCAVAQFLYRQRG